MPRYSIPVLTLIVVLLGASPTYSQVVHDGTILDRANKWDGYPAHIYENGVHKVWFCSQSNSGYRDEIWYSRKNGSLGPGGWSAPQRVLNRNNVPWANHHICDPSVIRINTTYNGTFYKYALYFTANVTEGSLDYNKIGVAFSNNGTNWAVHPNPIVVPEQSMIPGATDYGAGMSGVAFDPNFIRITDWRYALRHVYLDSSWSTIGQTYIRLISSWDGVGFFPSPSHDTDIQSGGRENDGQGPDIAYRMEGGPRWYVAIKNTSPVGTYDGETRILRSLNKGSLEYITGWEVIATFNSSVTGWSQNNNPGLGKHGDSQLFVDSGGWAYVFMAVGNDRPATNTWRVDQGRFRP